MTANEAMLGFLVITEFFLAQVTSQEMKINTHPCSSGGIVEIECCKSSNYTGMLEFRVENSNTLASLDFTAPPIKYFPYFNITEKDARCAVFSFNMTGEGIYICQMPYSLSVYINATSCASCSYMLQENLNSGSSCQKTESSRYFKMMISLGVAVVLLVITIIWLVIRYKVNQIHKIDHNGTVQEGAESHNTVSPITMCPSPSHPTSSPHYAGKDTTERKASDRMESNDDMGCMRIEEAD